MKKLLLFLLTVLLGLSSLTLSAQTTVEILGGGGTTTSAYLPAYTTYNNTLSEQIYTAEEVSMAGTITSISFFNGGTTLTPNIKLYMVNTTQTAFASTTNWLTVAAGDLVYEGNVTFTAGEWTTIELTTPFVYDGTSNLGIIVDENMQWSSGLACRVFTSTTNCAMYVYSDGTNYNAVGASYSASNRLSVKNQIMLEITPNNLTCHSVSNLSVNGLTANNATISWVASEDAASYLVQCKTAAQSWDDVEFETTTENSYTFSTLTPNTAYNVRVAAYCGGNDTSSWRNKSFSTPNVAVTLPYSQDFETDPENISDFTISNNGPNGWHIGSATGVIAEDATDSTGHALYISNDNGTSNSYNITSSSDAYAVLDVVFDDTPLEWHLSFDYKLNGEGTSTKYDYLSVYLMDASASIPSSGAPSGNALLYKKNLTPNWTSFDTILHDVIGTSKRIVFYWRNDGSQGSNPPAAVDNIAITGRSCMQPSNLAASDETPNGATITWVGDASEYALYVSGPTSGYYIANDNSYTFTDLTPSSIYYVQVRALCGDDSSTISLPISFITACDAIEISENTPWTESFESYVGADNTAQPFICWATPVTQVVSNGVSPFVYCGYGNACHSGHNSAEMKGTNVMLALPEFTNDIHDLRLSFWATTDNTTNYGTMEVGILPDTADPTSFEPLGLAGIPGARGSANGGNGNFMGPFDFNNVEASSGRIALRLTSASSLSWNLDDFTVSIIPNCPSPVKTSVHTTYIGALTADIAFSDIYESHNSWKVFYKEAADNDEDAWQFVTTSETSATLIGLEPSTAYEVYVITNCETPDTNPDSTMHITFTTKASCYPPVNVTISQVSGTSALVSWEAASFGANSYTVAYSVSGDDDWSEFVEENTVKMISGLEPNTTYEVLVYSNCTLGTADTIEKTFTTNCLIGGDKQIVQGTGTTTYLPGYNYYNYSYSQQIFLASELSGLNDIHSIAFNASSIASGSRHFKIYLMNTDAASSAWLDASSSQLVYDSTVTLTTGWNTFDFTAPFQRNSTDNLAVIVIDATGSYNSTYNYFRCHTTSQSLSSYSYQDDTPYSISTIPSSSYGSTTTSRNNVIFGSPCDSTATCVAPNIYVSEIDVTSVTIDWAPGYNETAWELEYTSDTTWTNMGPVTPPYELGNLSPNTLYNIRIRSNCGNGNYSEPAGLSVRTACGYIADLPFTETFDNYSTGTNAYPLCWDKNNTANNSTPYITSTHYQGIGSLYFYTSTTNTFSMAITPEFDESISFNTLQATFMYRATYDYNRLVVGVISDPEDASTFVAIDTVYPDMTTPSTWIEKEVYFNSYTGTDAHYIAFKNDYCGSNSYSYVDNLVINTISACPKPSDLTISSVSNTEATLTWTSNGSESAWNIAYGPVGIDPTDEEDEDVIIVAAYDNPFPLTDLEALTAYDVYIQADCGDGSVSDWTLLPVRLETAGCDTTEQCAYTFVLIDGYGDGWNDAYLDIVQNGVTIASVEAEDHDGVNEESVDTVTVSLCDNITTQLVWHSGSFDDEISFSLIGFDGAQIISMSDISDHFTGDVLTTFTTNCSGCITPSNLQYTLSDDATSVTITWTAGSEETSWILEYQAGDEEWVSENISGTPTYTLNNLTAATLYTIHVKAVCDFGISGYQSITFNTPICDPTDQCEYTLNLVDQYSDGWNGAYLTVKQNGIVVLTNITIPSGDNQNTVTFGLCGDLPTQLIWHKGNYDSECSYTLLAPDGTTIASHSGMSSVANNAVVDTFSANCSGCFAPSNLEYTLSEDGTSATITWTAGNEETAWILEYQIAGQSTWTIENITGTPTYTINNLVSSSNYNVRIKSNCEGGESGYANISFASLCDVASLPYTEDFESYVGTTYNDANGVTPTCWATYGPSTTYGVPHITSSGDYHWVHSGTNCMVFTGHTDAPNQYAALPTFDQPLNTLKLNFWRRMENVSYGTLTVGYVTDLNDLPNSFVAIDTIPSVASESTADTISVYFTGTNIPANGNICFHWFKDGTYYSCCIDDINVTVAGDTTTPITTYTVTLNTADATMGTVSPNTPSTVEAGTSFTATANANDGYHFVAWTSNNATVSTANPYTFTVNADITLTATFEADSTPVEPCDVPVNLHATNTDIHAVEIAWDPNANVSSWNIRYKVQDGSWNTATANTNSYTITGLTQNTTYEIQVQANCGNNNLSEWSSTLTVTTLIDGIVNYLESSVTLFPNPAKEYVDVRIDGDVNVTLMEVYDVYGKLIRNVNVIDNPTRINVSSLANGMYFVRVTTDAGMVTKTFVKK